MPIAACIAAIQASTPPTQSGSEATGEYLVFGLLVAVLALVVMMFVRTSSRRSSRQ
jgi:hypothetical protein